MKRVLLRGPSLSSSGYGVHTRQIFSYLLRRGDCDITTQVLPWGITPWCVNPDKDGGIYGQIMSRSRPLEGKYDVSIQVQLPYEWDHNLAHKNVGVTAGVETDACAPSWATLDRERMDLVLVPSMHTRMTLLKSATGREKTPIVVVPESYFFELLSSTTSPFAFATQKNFLTIGMVTGDNAANDRKNIINTIRWFCQEFDGVPDVGLIIKTSKGRETTIDRELVRKMLSQIIASTACKNPPKIYMLHGTMSREEMSALYHHPSIVGFVSATRGEGFGLPMLEAAVAGLPVICTNWSATTEFLSGPSYLPVEYNLISIPESRVDGKIFVKGARWADAREGDFKKKLRKLYENSQKYRSYADTLATSLRASHGQANIDKIYDAALGPLLVG